MTGILLSATGRLNTLLNTVVDDVFSFLDSRGGENPENEKRVKDIVKSINADKMI